MRRSLLEVVKLGELLRRSLNAVYLVMMKVCSGCGGLFFWFYIDSTWLLWENYFHTEWIIDISLLDKWILSLEIFSEEQFCKKELTVSCGMPFCMPKVIYAHTCTNSQALVYYAFHVLQELHLKTLLKRRSKEKRKRMQTLEKMMKWPTSLWMKKKLMRMGLLWGILNVFFNFYC